MMKLNHVPAIQATFSVQEEKVVQITLKECQIFSWEVIGKYRSSDLEEKIASWMDAYASGRQPKILLPLAFEKLSPFTIRSLNLLQQVPFGMALSYSELAVRIGNPLAARAVGNACANNPFPLVVPCHRVLARGNRLGGFAFGLPMKQMLLDFEQIAYIMP